MADVGKDPLPEFKKSILLAKKYKNVEILWASTREPYNYLQSKQIGCHIITVPPAIITKIENYGKSFNQLTLDTVNTSSGVPGSFGDSKTVPQITVNEKGLVTAVQDITISSDITMDRALKVQITDVDESTDTHYLHFGDIANTDTSDNTTLSTIIPVPSVPPPLRINSNGSIVGYRKMSAVTKVSLVCPLVHAVISTTSPTVANLVVTKPSILRKWLSCVTSRAFGASAA